MVRVVVQNCPACGFSKYEKVLTVLDYLVSNESFDIMECHDCSLRFTSPIPNKEDIGDYYKSDDYISHTGKANSIINKIYIFVQYFTLRSKRKIVKRISQKKSGSILDIGCGTGQFLKTMKQVGWNIIVESEIEIIITKTIKNRKGLRSIHDIRMFLRHV